MARPTPHLSTQPAWPALPGRLAGAVWRGSDLAGAQGVAMASGFAALDAQLPGGGWPAHGLTEIMLPPAAACEWRLLAPGLAAAAARGEIALVAPPGLPQAAALAQQGLPPARLLRIDAADPAQRLWAAEQLLKSDIGGAIVAWLPQARAEQLRRLQVHARACRAAAFVIGAWDRLAQASPAPLRVAVQPDGRWHLALHIVKRRGAPLEQPLRLLAVPTLLQAVLPQRLRRELASGGAGHVAEDAAMPAPITNAVHPGAGAGPARRAPSAAPSQAPVHP